MSALMNGESAAIRAMRVMCIFFMMSVHLYPGPNDLSFVTAGPFQWLGDIWLGYLGRASVAALSLVSGYLMSVALGKHGPVSTIRSRAQTLLVPMIAWNLIFFAVLLVLAMAGLESLSDRAKGMNPAFALFNATTGMFGPTVNISLFFLRDLFVCSVLVAVLAAPIRRYPGIALAIAFVLALFELSAPIVFRPTILLFFLTGFAMQSSAISLRMLARKQILFVVSVAYIGILGLYFRMADQSELVVNLEGIARRALLVAYVVLIAFQIGKLAKLQTLFDKYEPVTYFAYLSHVLVARAIWMGMDALGASLQSPVYLVYFFATPVFIFVAAAGAMPLINALPYPLPLLIKGKNAPRRVAASAFDPKASRL